MLAALFAALITLRQGVMWGMIHGALACRKAGNPIQSFSDLVPISMGMRQPCQDRFASVAYGRAYDAPAATMRTYAAGSEDVLAGVETPGARDDLPRLFLGTVLEGMDAGLHDKALTTVIDVLSGG